MRRQDDRTDAEAAASPHQPERAHIATPPAELFSTPARSVRSFMKHSQPVTFAFERGGDLPLAHLNSHEGHPS